MGSENLGAVVAHRRRELGVTQEELARHLGVTKAAVSKWELGQSLPDVALLPCLASYFGITLDELFDYQPQLGEAACTELGFKLQAAFRDDAAAAFECSLQTARAYWSCWGALYAVAQVLLVHALSGILMPDNAADQALVERCAHEACALFERVERCSGDRQLAGQARMQRLTILHAQGRFDEVVGELESEASELGSSLGSEEMLLAGAYTALGRTTDALRVNERMVLCSAMRAASGLLGQLALPVVFGRGAGAAERVDLLVKAGEALEAAFGASALNPSFMPTLYYRAALQLLPAASGAGEAGAPGSDARVLEAAAGEAAGAGVAGAAARAGAPDAGAADNAAARNAATGAAASAAFDARGTVFGYLGRYADACEALFERALLEADVPVLFHEVEDLVRGTVETAKIPGYADSLEESCAAMRLTFKQLLDGSVWDFLRDDPAFVCFVERLEQL